MARQKVAAPVLVGRDEAEVRHLIDLGLNVDTIAKAGRRHNAALGVLDALLHDPQWLEANYVEPASDALKFGALAEKIGGAHCPSYYLQGFDAAGHRFAKELYCGREWCPVCGQKDSPSHLRRFASWLPKAMQTRELGLMVIELPLASRDKWRRRKALEESGRRIKQVLTGEWEVRGRRMAGEMLRKGEVAEIKARWFNKGLRRPHYFGDDPAKEMQRLGLEVWTDRPASSDIPPAAGKSNVHWNVLLPVGYILKKRLRHIVHTLRIALGEPELILHYGYAQTPGQIVHLVKYTTRATFLDYRWDEHLAGQLYGFRAMRSWGVWDGPALWSLDDLGEARSELQDADMLAVHALGESRCPLDGLPITWSKPRPIRELRELDATGEAKPIGAGYWRLLDVAPSEHFREDDHNALLLRHLLVQLTRDLTYDDRLQAEYAIVHGEAAAERVAPVAEFVFDGEGYVSATDAERRADWLVIANESARPAPEAIADVPRGAAENLPPKIGHRQSQKRMVRKVAKKTSFSPG